MVQPQYSPQEALERVKLMMNYDSSKTLTENREIIFEQSSFGEASQISQELVNALVGDVKTSDLSEIETILKDKVFGKVLDDGTCLLNKVNEYFKNTKTSRWFTWGVFVPSDYKSRGLKDMISLSKEESEPQFEDVKKGILKLIDDEMNGFCKSPKKEEGKKDEGKKEEEKKQQVRRQYVACSGTSEQPFKKLCYEKDPNGPLHKVQACIGVTPDGKFWNKTEQALVQKTGKNSFTINDVNTICGTKPDTQKPSIDDEFGTGEEEASSILDQ